MGRTNPTFRDRLRGIEDDWQPFRRGLRASDQPYFDQCFTDAAAHADAAGYQNPVDPWPALLVSILIEQQRRIERLEARCEQLTEGDADGPADADGPTDTDGGQ